VPFRLSSRQDLFSVVSGKTLTGLSVLTLAMIFAHSAKAADQTFTDLDNTSGNLTITAPNNVVTTISAGSTYSDQISGTGNLHVESGGTGQTFTIGGVQTYTGTTTFDSSTTEALTVANALSSSSAVTANGTMTFGGNSQTLNNLASASGNGNISLQGATLTANITAPTTWYGTISDGGSAGNLVVTGNSTWTVGHAQSYTGTTDIQNGATVAATATSAFSTSSAFTVETGGAFNFSTFSQTVNNLSGGGNITETTGVLTVNETSNTTYSGVITSSGGPAGGFTKTGSANLTLTADNGYLGETLISAGTLTADATDGQTLINSADVNISAGATFALGNNEKINNLISASSTSNVALGSYTLTNLNGSNTTFAGVIAGSGNLTQGGVGYLELTNDNTYTGATTINSGSTLRIDAADGNTIASSSGVAVTGTLDLNNTSQSIKNLTGAGTVAAGTGTLTDNITGTTSFSGAITGSGGLTVNGTGTLTIGAALADTGATTIGSGATVKAGVANIISASSSVADNGTFDLNSTAQTLKNLTGSGAINLDGGALTVNETSNTSFTGNIVDGTLAGTGLTLSGGSTLTLSGTNTYSGGTNINAGTLSIASNANLGNGTVAMATGTTLALTGATTVTKAITLASGAETINTNANADTISSVIGGGGTLVKSGTGTLTLSNTNTYTGGTNVNAGTLSIAADANLGSGTVAMANSTTLSLTGATTLTKAFALTGTSTINTNANADTISTIIGGAGGFIKSGTGALTINNANTYTGTTEVAAGTLYVDGNDTAATGALTVDSGATLKGSGTLGGNLVNNGTVNPGDSPGTLTVSGNYSGSGTLNEEFTGSNTAGNFDKLVISGTATITGQTLVYNPIGVSPATQYVRGTAYTILTSSALTGTFSNLANGAIVTSGSTGANAASAANIAASDDPNLAIQTTYTSNSVIATILRGQFFAAAPNATPNEISVGRALDSMQLTTTSGPVNDLMNAVSATPIANQAAALNTLTGEINADMQTAALNGMHQFNGLLAKRLGGDCNTDDNLDNPGSPVSSMHQKLGQSGTASNASAWACGYGSFDSISGSGGTSGYNTTLAGTTMGIEFKPSSVTTVRAGFGYSHADTGVNATTATSNAAQIGVYGQYDFLRTQNANFYVGGTLAGGYDFINTQRQIALTNSTATATPTAYDLSTSALIGFTTHIHDVTVEPVAAEEFVFNNQRTYTEGGAGGADLTVDGRSLSSLRSSVGAQASTRFGFNNGMALTPQVHAALIYDAFDLSPSLTESIGGTPFTVSGANPGRAGIQGGAGGTLDMGGGFAGFLDYNGTFKEHETDNLVMGGIKLRW
jgi:autotransporter-associated beta strand protein